MSLTLEYREKFAGRRFSSLHVSELSDICQVLSMAFARRSILHPSGGSESSSLFPFLFALFCSPLIFKESNYGNEITKQLKLTLIYAVLHARHALSNLLILFLH